MPNISIGIDLGGTRIKAVAIDEQGKILHQHYETTNDGNEEIWKNAIAAAVKEIQNKIEGTADSCIGLSAPGLPNADNSAIAFMPGRLQGLENFVWTKFLNNKSYVLNDANSAMMAEARHGAAKNTKNAILLTLGTGVGGAILINGVPYQEAFNKAGHIGHMVIDSEGEPDIIGIPGSLEDAIGNCTIEKRTEGKFRSTREMLESLKKRDRFAKDVWLLSIKKLAIGLASLTNILSPELIVIGGGITEAGKELF